MRSFKKMLFGEKMPDKDDPKYKERYMKEVNAGMKFARLTRLDKLAARVQNYANLHTKAFLVIVFGFVLFCFSMNIYRLIWVSSYNCSHERAIDRQENVLNRRHIRQLNNAVSAQNRVSKEINQFDNE